eukprot:SAG11_NODE_8166_length_1053_cov_1.285115_1_plen_139_part_10
MPFRVLAFPDNQYFHQEPGTNAEIEKYVAGSTHSWPDHPKASWDGTVVPPAIFFAKTRGFSGAVPKPPSWAPGLTGSWCNTTDIASCAPASAGCCAKNEVVWKWLAGQCENEGPAVCNSSAYPPAWNFACVTACAACPW